MHQIHLKANEDSQGIFELLLNGQIDQQATDLWLAAGHQPWMRQHGKTVPFGTLDSNFEFSLPQAEMQGITAYAAQLGGIDCKEPWDGTPFQFSFSYRGFRFRGGVSVQTEGLMLTLRKFLPSLEKPIEYGIPEKVFECIDEFHRGIIAVTSPAGDGKSTTLAFLLNRIAGKRPLCMAILGRTTEYEMGLMGSGSIAFCVHKHIGSTKADIASYTEGIKLASRESADLIVVSEIDNADTLRTVFDAAARGHLVFVMLYARDGCEAIQEMEGLFPSSERAAAREMISKHVNTIISQIAFPSLKEKGLVHCFSILKMTTGMQNHVCANKLSEIRSSVETGARQGMMSLEESIIQQIHAGHINDKMASSKVPDLAYFKNKSTAPA